MKKINLFDVSSIEADLFLSKLFEFLQVEFSTTQNEFATSICLLKTSLHIISLVLSWTKVRSVFNGNEMIAFLGLKIQNLVLLEIKQKKDVNVFIQGPASLRYSRWFNYINGLNNSKTCYCIFIFQYPAGFPICTNNLHFKICTFFVYFKD